MAKLIDILAREIEVWPHNSISAMQDYDGSINHQMLNGTPEYSDSLAQWKARPGGLRIFGCKKLTLADDFETAKVTRAEWQAAVDALNAPKVVEWDGVGDPPVGTVCEYDARPVGKGDPLFVTVEVKYVSDQSIVIICTDVPDGEKKENIGVELALMNGLAMRGKFRAIRTADQVAADERKKSIDEMVFGVCGCEPDGGNTATFMVCGFLYDAGYRKQ